MIEREINVVERIPYLMRNCRTQASDNGRLFSLLQLRLKLAFLFELGRHFVKTTGELAHLIGSLPDPQQRAALVTLARLKRAALGDKP